MEQVLWSLPLSLGISGIGCYWLARYAGLAATVAVAGVCGVACLLQVLRDGLARRRVGGPSVALGPLGWAVLAIMLAWAIFVAGSLIDLQSGERLYPSLLLFDHSTRTAWTESVMRTGVPPDNPLYRYGAPAPMRNYYYWYILCAVAAKLGQLPARAMLAASCVWSGWALAALLGLYLKHFLQVGQRLWVQFPRVLGLLLVSGLGVLVNAWRLTHGKLPYIEVWPNGQIGSWTGGLLYAPHHAAGLVCCMTAVLLVWMVRKAPVREAALPVVLAGFCFASAFGYTVFVAFAFFLVMPIWAAVQMWRQKEPRAVLWMLCGGGCAVALSVPYLLGLAHGTSAQSGPALFTLAVRETVPAEGMLADGWLRAVAVEHPRLAVNIANLLWLVPGYFVEMGFAFFVFLTYMVSRLREGTQLDEARRWLLTIAVGALPVMTFVRSNALSTNDFGWKSALLFEFPMALLGSEVLMAWRCRQLREVSEEVQHSLPLEMPGWLRLLSAVALLAGVGTTLFQSALLRTNVAIVESNLRAAGDAHAEDVTHGAYVLYEGFRAMRERMPESAVVQFNPSQKDNYWLLLYQVGVGRQMAIVSDRPWCGAELGGDPGGCMPMAKALDAVFVSATADEARLVCREFGIEYLVVTAYDPAWKRDDGWVWTLPVVVAQPEFRAVACR